MITIDDREEVIRTERGKRDGYPDRYRLVPLVNAIYGADIASVSRLDFGDAYFLGNGPDGPASLSVGFEIKRIGEAIQSIEDPRFVSEQLPGLQETYNRIYLIIEGVTRTDRETGELLRPRGKEWVSVNPSRKSLFRASTFNAWLTSRELQGLIVIRTNDAWDTANAIVDKYKYFSKPWADHKSSTSIYNAVKLTNYLPSEIISLRRKVAAVFDCFGVKRSGIVADAFPTIRGMINADEERIAALQEPASYDEFGRPTRFRKFGVKVAKKYNDAVTGTD